jgi:hypothetical protein
MVCLSFGHVDLVNLIGCNPWDCEPGQSEIFFIKQYLDIILHESYIYNF